MKSKIDTAFSLVEVQIAMIVLTIGLMGLIATLQTHSRQIEVAESWCRQDMQYYIVSQSNKWMRQIGMPAELTTDPTVTAWQPFVTGDQTYEIELDSYLLDLENRTASAEVKLKKVN